MKALHFLVAILLGYGLLAACTKEDTNPTIVYVHDTTVVRDTVDRVVRDTVDRIIHDTIYVDSSRINQGTATQRLTGKNWKLVASTINPGLPVSGGGVITDYYAQLTNCNRDDLTRFNTDNTFVVDEGASRCVGGDPQIVDYGTWSWVNNQTIVRLVSTRNSTASEWTVEELLPTRLKVHYTVVHNGVTYRFTNTYLPN